MHGCPLAIGKRDRHSFSTVRLSNVSESFWVFFHMLNSMFSLENINTCMTRLSGVTSFLRLQDWYVETHHMWIANLFVSVVSFIKLSCGPLWPIPWIAMSLQPWEHFSVKKGIRAEFCIPLALLGWFLTETFHWRTHVDFEFPWSCRKVIVLLEHLETQRFRRCFGGKQLVEKKRTTANAVGSTLTTLEVSQHSMPFGKGCGNSNRKKHLHDLIMNLWRDQPFLSLGDFFSLAHFSQVEVSEIRDLLRIFHMPESAADQALNRNPDRNANVEIYMLDDGLVSLYSIGQKTTILLDWVNMSQSKCSREFFGYLTSWLAAYCSQFNGMFIPHISGMYVHIWSRNTMGFYEAYQLSARSVYVMFSIYPHAPLSSYWKYGYVCLYCMLFPLIASYVDSHMPTFVGYVGPLCFKPFGLYHVDLVRTWWSDVAPYG